MKDMIINSLVTILPALLALVFLFTLALVLKKLKRKKTNKNICKKCGAILESKDTVCHKCGWKVEK